MSTISIKSYENKRKHQRLEESVEGQQLDDASCRTQAAKRHKVSEKGGGGLSVIARAQEQSVARKRIKVLYKNIRYELEAWNRKPENASRGSVIDKADPLLQLVADIRIAFQTVDRDCGPTWRHTLEGRQIINRLSSRERLYDGQKGYVLRHSDIAIPDAHQHAALSQMAYSPAELQGPWQEESEAVQEIRKEATEFLWRPQLEERLRKHLLKNPVITDALDDEHIHILNGPLDISLDLWASENIIWMMGEEFVCHSDIQECACCGNDFGPDAEDIWELQGFVEPRCSACKIEQWAHGVLADRIADLKSQVAALEKMRDAPPPSAEEEA